MKLMKKKKQLTFDREEKKPVLRSSICTGETVAGFKHVKTGRFEEVMLIRTEQDLKDFMEQYQIIQSEIIREW